MQQLNYFLFPLINATPESPFWMVTLATVIAKYVIYIIPISLICLWLWGPRDTITLQRHMIIKTAMALAFSMLFSACIGMLMPHARPFVAGIGYSFITHSANSSFPSNHGTAIFTFALAFLFWHRLWSGISLMIIASAIAWSRVYLGIHWPMDMAGALMVSVIGCLFAQLLWNLFGANISGVLFQLYRSCFSLPISKGWVRE